MRKGAWGGDHLWSSRWIPALLLALSGVILVADAASRLDRRGESELARLKAVSEERARALQQILSRVDRELGAAGQLSLVDESRDGVMAIASVREHLADLGPGVEGVAWIGASGEVVAVQPASALDDVRVLVGMALSGGGAEEGRATVHGGVLLARGYPALGLVRRVGGGGAEFLLALLSFEDLPGVSPPPSGQVGDAGLLLLDASGIVIAHSNPAIVGAPLHSPEDSIGDPELNLIWPQILGGGGGAWKVVSDRLSEGSWARGSPSLLALSPVTVPGPGRWSLGVQIAPGTTGLPGLPRDLPVGAPALFLCVALVGLAFLIPRERPLRRLLAEARGRAGWYGAIVEGGADGFLVLDPSGRVTLVNEAFCWLVGSTPGKVEGRLFGELLDIENPGEREPAETGPPLGKSEMRLRASDGSTVEVEVSTGPVDWDGTEFRLALVRDVSWRRQMERELLGVGERERLLLGRELHDGLGQHLTGVAFMAKTLARKLVDGGGPGAEDADNIGRLINDAVAQIRTLARGLELSEYEGKELPAALEEMSGVVRRLMGVGLRLDLEVDLENGAPELDRFQATQLYRVCHDVVSDAVRKHLARNIEIALTKAGDRMVLTIRQDGGGFRDGMERVSYRLRYRARLLNASLDVSEDPRGGTRTVCSFQVGRGSA